MTREEIVERIRASGGRWIRVTFIKRTTGETRVLVGRLGVKKYLKGGVPAYDFNEHNLILIWDRDKKEYRTIPIEGIVSIATEGEQAEVG